MEAKFIAYTDASACRGMLLRSGVGRIKHLTTKQLWAQGAVASYGVVIEKIPRAVNNADAFTHSVWAGVDGPPGTIGFQVYLAAGWIVDSVT